LKRNVFSVLLLPEAVVTTSFGIAVVSQAHVLVRSRLRRQLAFRRLKRDLSLPKPPAPSFSNRALGRDPRAHSGLNACSDPWSLRIDAMKGCAARRLTRVRWLTFSRRQRDAPTLTDVRFDTVSALREITVRQQHRLVPCCLRKHGEFVSWQSLLAYRYVTALGCDQCPQEPRS
jgi:hypothetical protein